MNTRQARIFAAQLRTVAAELQEMAAWVEQHQRADTFGEMPLPPSTHALEAQGAIWNLLKQDGEI